MAKNLRSCTEETKLPLLDGPEKKYQVLRHSGRSGAEFRVVLDTDDAEKARLKYEDISISLRQGAVRFVRHGVIANSTSAPRLRSRW